MGISTFQFEQMQLRLARNASRDGTNKNCGVEREIGDLHHPIIEWCKTQSPPVPYIHARTDQASTIAKGAPDFVLFINGKALLIECKTKTGKCTTDQLAWHRMAKDQKFPVFIVRSMDDFLEIVHHLCKPEPFSA